MQTVLDMAGSVKEPAKGANGVIAKRSGRRQITKLEMDQLTQFIGVLARTGIVEELVLLVDPASTR